MSTARSLCLPCRLQRVSYVQRPVASISPWLQAGVRFASSARQSQRRRKPARMELSSRVSSSSPRQGSGRKPPSRSSNSPFASMNQGSARVRDKPQERRSPEPGTPERETRGTQGRKAEERRPRAGPKRTSSFENDKKEGRSRGNWDKPLFNERKPSPRFHNSPFGGMNQARVRLREKPKERRTQAEMKRASSYEENKPGKKSKDTEEKPLFKALKMQEALASVSYERRNAVKTKLGNITSFEQFNLLPAVQEAIRTGALPNMTELTPTPIQRLSIPAILRSRSRKPKSATEEDDDGGTPNFDQYLLAAETGSGKTLGYVIPIVNAVKHADMAQKERDAAQEEQLERERKAKRERRKQNDFELDSPELTTAEASNMARPKAIILVPTSELVNQVGSVVKSLSHTVKYRTALLSSSYTPRRIKSTLLHPGGIDILVTTPHLVSSIAEVNPYIFSRVTHLVIDEADSLLDRSFSPVTSKVLEKTAPSLQKLVFCSATIPRSLDTYLRNHFPQVERLVTPNLHAIPRRVQLGVIDIDKQPYHGSRNKACADAIWSLGKSRATDNDVRHQVTGYREPKSIIVFVNRRETAEEVANYLGTMGIDAVSLSRDMTEKRQAETMAEFTVPKPPPSEEDLKLMSKNRYRSDSIPFESDTKSGGSHHRLEDTKVLVVTDLGSRGIDTLAVKTVILYDVPHNSVDFIHRLGRVGRMNKRGRGIVLVGKKDRKDVVREIRDAMFRGQALI